MPPSTFTSGPLPIGGFWAPATENAVKQYEFQETLSALLVGGVPCALTARFYGVDEMISAFKALSPSWALLLWFLFLAVVPFIIEYFAQYFFDRNLSNPGLIVRCKAAAYEVSTTLQGVYRSAAGFTFIIMIPAFLEQPSAFGLFSASVMLLFSAGSLWLCCMLSSWKRARH